MLHFISIPAGGISSVTHFLLVNIILEIAFLVNKDYNAIKYVRNLVAMGHKPPYMKFCI